MDRIVEKLIKWCW